MEEAGSKKAASHGEQTILWTSELLESEFLLSYVLWLSLVPENVLFWLRFLGKLFLACWVVFPLPPNNRIMKSPSRIDSLVITTWLSHRGSILNFSYFLKDVNYLWIPSSVSNLIESIQQDQTLCVCAGSWIWKTPADSIFRKPYSLIMSLSKW